MRLLVVLAVSSLVFVSSAFALDQKKVPLSRSGGSKGTVSHTLQIPADTHSAAVENKMDDMMARPNFEAIESEKEMAKESKKSISISRSGGSASARKIKTADNQ